MSPSVKPSIQTNSASTSSTNKQEEYYHNVNTFSVDQNLKHYLTNVVNREAEVLTWIHDTTHERVSANAATMLSSPDQARLMTAIAHMLNAKLVVEVGVFTGYSSTAFALGMQAGEGGRIVALDVSEEYTQIAREAWKRAGVENMIELRIAPAMESLEKMVTVEAEKFVGKVDLMYVDADKEHQADYYEYALKLLRPRGVVILDNTLRGGRVYNKNVKEDNEGTVAMRRANEKIAADDQRVLSVLLPFADGMTIVSKKQTSASFK